MPSESGIILPGHPDYGNERTSKPPPTLPSVGTADPFAAAGVAPSEGSWIRSTDGWREQILTWYAQGPRAGEWRSNGDLFKAFEPARKNAGMRRSALIQQLRKLVSAGLLEKRIDYERRVPHRSPYLQMPLVWHRATRVSP